MQLIVSTCVEQKGEQAWGYATFIGLSSVIAPVFIGKLCLLQAFTLRSTRARKSSSFRGVFTQQWQQPIGNL